MSWGEGSPELNSVFMFSFTLAELWVSVCEALFAIGLDSMQCNWLTKVIQLWPE